MADIIRDAAIGQFIRWVTNNRYLQYPEEKADFQLPEAYANILNGTSSAVHRPPTFKSSTTLDDDDAAAATDSDDAATVAAAAPAPLAHVQSHRSGVNNITEAALEADELHHLEKKQSLAIAPQQTKDGAILVTDAADVIQAIAPLTGRSTKPLFRYPFGDRNTTTTTVVNAAGYVPFRWTVDSLGWQGTSGGRSPPGADMAPARRASPSATAKTVASTMPGACCPTL